MDSERQLWHDNMHAYTNEIRAKHEQRVKQRLEVYNGYTGDNFCDVCGMTVKVYAFHAIGDDSIHMYCYYCAEAVSRALDNFVKEYNNG